MRKITSLFMLFCVFAATAWADVDEAKAKLTALTEFIYSQLPPVELQTSDSEAAFYLTATQDADGNTLSKGIDGNTSTFYGSVWGAVTGSSHFWQICLADEAIEEFKFSFITRADGKDIPTTIDVKGSTDNESYETIVSLTNSTATTGGATYMSDVISNAKGYKYIRFEVPFVNGGFKLGENEYTIALAEIGFYALPSNSNFVSELENAEDLIESTETTEAEYEQAFADLVELYNGGKPTYPFTLTTDDANPTLYAIRSGRTNEGKQWWYTYDSSDGLIALNEYANLETQYWYFKEVVAEDYGYAVQMYPYVGGGKAMSYDASATSVSESAKVFAKELGTTGWSNYWKLVATNGNAPYGFKTYDGKNFLSNNGGYKNKMGMWNDTPSNDGGTAMYFITPSDYLQDIIDNAEALLTNNGTAIGSYTQESLSNLQTALDEFEENIENITADDIANLKAAINGIEMIVPEIGKYYRIENVSRKTKIAYNGTNRVPAESGKSDISQLWMFETGGTEGTFKIKNVNASLYMKNPTDGNELVEEGAADYELIALGDAQVNLRSGYNLVDYGNGNGLGYWSPNPKDSDGAWYITEATDIEVVIGDAGYATTYLPFDAKLPAGLKAYAVTATSNSSATLTEKADIKANQGAILQGDAKTYTLTIGTASSDWTGNMLKGSNVATQVTDDGYVLAKPQDKEVGLYKATLTEGKFLNNANKAYLPAGVAAGARLLFDFGTETAIESIEGAENADAVVYDLAGRRVKVAQKGLYIVNGKKVIK